VENHGRAGQRNFVARQSSKETHANHIHDQCAQRLPARRNDGQRAQGCRFSASKQGDLLSVVGPSGSGKTTLLNIIGCIDKPSSGEVSTSRVKNITTARRQCAHRSAPLYGRLHISNIQLIPVLDVLENVEFPLLLMKENASF
jgi:ABC-type lipoprotein export system ATPase subunit